MPVTISVFRKATTTTITYSRPYYPSSSSLNHIVKLARSYLGITSTSTSAPSKSIDNILIPPPRSHYWKFKFAMMSTTSRSDMSSSNKGCNNDEIVKPHSSLSSSSSAAAAASTSEYVQRILGCDLEVDMSKDGFMKVCLNSNSNSSSTASPSQNVNTNGDNTTTSNNNSNNNDDGSNSSECIPETVLQYERQIRKNKAAKRASAPLSKSQLHVMYNDEHIIVTHKPSGVLTVPGVNSNPSLLSLLYDEYKDQMEESMMMEHMIIHRLDM